MGSVVFLEEEDLVVGEDPLQDVELSTAGECSMLCRKPFMAGAVHFGCGQCLPCRIKKNRVWTHRLLLESMKHDKSCFVTLTYDDNNLPDKEFHPNGNLKVKDVQTFLKRLRYYSNPIKLRHFYVGEYGSRSERAHYHLAIFGLGIEDQALFDQSWSHGYSYLGELTRASAQYICKYIQKRWTNKRDPKTIAALNGRNPEFARMSLKPGIGASAMVDVASAFACSDGANLLITDGDIPMALRSGKRSLPLGRYLRRKFREFYGFEEIGAQDGWSLQASLQALQKFDEFASQEENLFKSYTQLQKELREKEIMKINVMENRQKIFNQGGML